VVSCTTPAATGTPSPSPGASQAALSPRVPACRLPAMLWSFPNPETQGGFIDTASGSFTADPQSLMVLDSAKGLYRTPTQPYLYGPNAGDPAIASSSYDRSQGRWLPVPPQYVSPDGSTYAYYGYAAFGHAGVHLVDVATGSDRLIPGTIGPSPQAHYLIAGYLQDGVYLTQWGPTGGPGLGLWRLNPASGAVTQVSTDAPGSGVFVGDTPLENPPTAEFPDAWWTSVSSDFSAGGDPYVYFQYLSGTAGQHGEDWFQRPGFRMNVIGVDTAGRAVVVATSPGQVEVWLLATPNSATPLYSTSNSGSPDLPFKAAVADDAGWWIGSRKGLFFATATAFAQVSATPAVAVGGCGY